MAELATSRHLYQPPRYRSSDLSWHDSWAETLSCSGSRLTFEPAAVLSLLSFNFVLGDLTLLREIRRQPWLSSIGPGGEPVLEPIPPHGLRWEPLVTIADELGRRLCDEAARACFGRSQVYILLSGGLDSRVIAATLARLVREGRIPTNPVAVTWGLPDSRDAAYGRETARILGFEWTHLPLAPQHVVENVENCARLLGASVSPVHLHRMPWFRSAPRDALVLAGNYGDMVGRAEFSGQWLLELSPLRPSNAFGLLRAEIAAAARDELEAALGALRARAPGRPGYEACEHEMHGHYTRGLIAHSMSVINNFCDVYQMFTDPNVYTYMWSLHPSLRSDAIYAILLERLHPNIARLPWARTNRALRGVTRGARPDVRRNFHDYAGWISGPLYPDLSGAVDPDWFAATGLFDPNGVRRVKQLVSGGPDGPGGVYGNSLFEMFTWLACFRRMIDGLAGQGKTVRLDPPSSRGGKARPAVPLDRMSRLRRLLSSSPTLSGAVQTVRRRLLRFQARLRYRPDG